MHQLKYKPLGGGALGTALIPAKLIILNAKFIVFYTPSLVFDTKFDAQFLVIYTKVIIFAHDAPEAIRKLLDACIHDE